MTRFQRFLAAVMSLILVAGALLALPSESLASSATNGPTSSLAKGHATSYECRGQFRDLVGHPACAAVELLYDFGVVAGDGHGNYRPDDLVRRDEFAKLITLVVGQPPLPDESLPFSDTTGNWAAQMGFIQAARHIGAINGYDDGTFRPWANVARSEVAKIVAAALYPDSIGGTPAYVDVPAGEWYTPYVATAARMGMIGGLGYFEVFTGDHFYPHWAVTRGEAAMVLANAKVQVAQRCAAQLKTKLESGDFSSIPNCFIVESSLEYEDLPAEQSSSGPGVEAVLSRRGCDRFALKVPLFRLGPRQVETPIVGVARTCVRFWYNGWQVTRYDQPQTEQVTWLGFSVRAEETTVEPLDIAHRSVEVSTRWHLEWIIPKLDWKVLDTTFYRRYVINRNGSVTLP